MAIEKKDPEHLSLELLNDEVRALRIMVRALMKNNHRQNVAISRLSKSDDFITVREYFRNIAVMSTKGQRIAFSKRVKAYCAGADEVVRVRPEGHSHFRYAYRPSVMDIVFADMGGEL